MDALRYARHERQRTQSLVEHASLRETENIGDAAREAPEVYIVVKPGISPFNFAPRVLKRKKGRKPFPPLVVSADRSSF